MIYSGGDLPERSRRPRTAAASGSLCSAHQLVEEGCCRKQAVETTRHAGARFEADADAPHVCSHGTMTALRDYHKLISFIIFNDHTYKNQRSLFFKINGLYLIFLSTTPSHQFPVQNVVPLPEAREGSHTAHCRLRAPGWHSVRGNRMFMLVASVHEL